MKKHSYFTKILLGSLFFLLTPELALAQEFDSVLNNLANGVGSSTTVIQLISYISGAVLAFTALKKFQHYTEQNPNNAIPLADPIMRMVGAACLVAFPWFLSVALGTLGIGTAHTAINQVTGAPAPGPNLSLDQELEAFMGVVYGPAKILIKISCYVFGAILGLVGLIRLARSGQGGGRDRQHTPAAIVGYFVGAAFLLAIGQMMDVVRTTLFGGAHLNFNTLAYARNLPDPASVNAAFTAIFGFVEIIGWIAFARGILLLRKLSEGDGQKTHLNAFVHIIAGGCAVNMGNFITVLQNTLGTQIIGTR